MPNRPFPLPVLVAALLTVGCEGRDADVSKDLENVTGAEGGALKFVLSGQLASRHLNEASGIQSGYGGSMYVHNDEEERLFVVDASGADLGEIAIEESANRDWEDLARVPSDEGPLLVIADTGDNNARRKRVSLYFVPESQLTAGGAAATATHRLRLSYPDGPRDVEAVAFDPVSGMILLLSKRDQPPRLYGVPLDLALWQNELEAEFLAEVPTLRPPTRTDIVRSPARGLWVSQPTGMDIAPDGRTAAVLTYRSLYLFDRAGDETWAQAFQRAPREIIGPPGFHDEAVTFSLDGTAVYVTTEGRPAPLHRLDLPVEE